MDNEHLGLILFLVFVIAGCFLVGVTITSAFEDRSKEIQKQECCFDCRTYSTNYYKCDITAYSADVSQTDSTPYKTALMEKPRVGGTCAVSRDLKQFLGMKVYIFGVGVFRVNDLMNERYEKRIDIFLGSKEKAKEFGLKEDVEVVFFRSK